MQRIGFRKRLSYRVITVVHVGLNVTNVSQLIRQRNVLHKIVFSLNKNKICLFRPFAHS